MANNYQFSFERPNNNGGFNRQNAFLNRNYYNPVTVQPSQTAITPENSPNYYNARGILNLKVDTDLPTD